MKTPQAVAALVLAGAIVGATAPALGQGAPAPAQQPAAQPAPQQWTFKHTPAAVVQDLGLFLYPKNNQPPEQQSKDLTECLLFANSQTGIELDTFTKTTLTAEEMAAASKPGAAPKGGAVKGAAKGAAAGAAIGAIAGDTGTGAGVGAAAGAMKGRKDRKEAQAQAGEQQKAAAAKALTDAKETVKKPLSACLDAKGYSAK